MPLIRLTISAPLGNFRRMLEALKRLDAEFPNDEAMMSMWLDANATPDRAFMERILDDGGWPRPLSRIVRDAEGRRVVQDWEG